MKRITDSAADRRLQIGNVVLENNIMLAPMAGVTDLPFRLICKEQGAGLLCMEMVSAKAVHFHNKNTEALMEIHPEEFPVSLQLFGSEPEIMAETAKRIEERPFAILDINMGCPVPKVVNNHEGSALMLEPKLAKLRQKVKAAKLEPKIAVCHYYEQANLLGAAINFKKMMER